MIQIDHMSISKIVSPVSISKPGILGPNISIQSFILMQKS